MTAMKNTHRHPALVSVPIHDFASSKPQEPHINDHQLIVFNLMSFMN